MATIRQKRFVRKLLENISDEKNDKSLAKIAIESGFTKAVAKAPSRIMKGKGVIELFKKAGVSAENIAMEWNKVLAAKPKEKKISWDSKIKGLTALNKLFFENPESKIAPQLQFIDKFLNVQMLQNPQNPQKENGVENNVKNGNNK